jgi:hypothetical protein
VGRLIRDGYPVEHVREVWMNRQLVVAGAVLVGVVVLIFVPTPTPQTKSSASPSKGE